MGLIDTLSQLIMAKPENIQGNWGKSPFNPKKKGKKHCKKHAANVPGLQDVRVLQRGKASKAAQQRVLDANNKIVAAHADFQTSLNEAEDLFRKELNTANIDLTLAELEVSSAQLRADKKALESS